MARSNSSWSLVFGCLLALSAPTLAGCGDDTKVEPTPELDASVSPTADASSPDADDDDDDDADDEEDDDVPCTADFPQYSDGMTTKSGDLTVRLLTISPTPPRQLMNNNWVIEVVNADQTPNTDAVVANPDSYMPVHRHHGTTTPTMMSTSTPGQYQINGITFRMRGPWQVNFTITPPGGKAVITTFQICVQ